MPTLLLIALILIVGCSASAYATELKCKREFVSSEWQIIRYTGSSVEPEKVYICKNCNKKTNVNYRYCPNCGASMKNGESRIYYSGNIDLSE